MQSLDTTALKEKPSSSSSFFLVVFPPTASSIRVLHVHFLPAAQTKPPMSWADALLGAPGLFFSPSSKGWSGLLSGWKMHLAPNYVFETFVCRIMSAYVKTSSSFRASYFENISVTLDLVYFIEFCWSCSVDIRSLSWIFALISGSLNCVVSEDVLGSLKFSTRAADELVL